MEVHENGFPCGGKKKESKRAGARGSPAWFRAKEGMSNCSTPRERKKTIHQKKRPTLGREKKRTQTKGKKKAKKKTPYTGQSTDQCFRYTKGLHGKGKQLTVCHGSTNERE